MGSEIARLKERLQLEANAVFQGFYGFAEVARHQIIQQKLQCVGEAFEQLKQLMDEEEAAYFMLNALEQAQQPGGRGQTNTAER
jgi:hypothetical protein